MVGFPGQKPKREDGKCLGEILQNEILNLTNKDYLGLGRKR